MNTLNPIPSSPPPATTPTATAVNATAPTLGSLLGSALGVFLATKSGAADPLVGNAIVVATTTFVTGLFHWLGGKLGVAVT